MNDVDERILSMRFENDDFERGVEETIGTIDKLNRSLASLGGGEANSSINALQSSFDKLNFDSLAQAIDTINYRFSDFGIASARIIENLADQVFDLGETIVKSLTIDPIAMGWGEYNQLIDISKIIQANTKASMSEINDITDALNTYADKTIYNYANMSSIMQQFIQATGSLETTIQSTGETMSTEKMVEALANYTALTGKGNTELSRVGLQFSRLLMGGDFNKQVMNSLLRNGAAGKIFQETWQRAAKNIGLGGQLQAAIEEAGSFMNSFSRQQAKKNFLSNGQNSEILLEFFRILTDPNDPLGRKAIAAAKTPTTFGQVKDQSLEAIQTGWTRIWRTIVGDLEEAKEIWRVVNQHLNETTGVLNKYSEVVGSLFEEWKELGGRTELINGLFDAFQGLYNIVVSLGNIFGQFFPGINADTLSDFSSGFQEGAENFLSWTEDLRAFFGDFLKGYDFWTEHHVEEIEQDPLVFTPDNDPDLLAEYERRVNNWLAGYEGLFQQWLNQYMGPEYFKTDKEGNIVFDEKSVNKAIKALGWESFKDSKDSEGRSLAKQATELASILVGAADDTGFNRGLHTGGIMSDEYFSQLSYDEIERELKLSILRENGINTYQVLEEIRDELTRYEEQPPQIEEWDDHGVHALLRKGIELNDETAVLYRHQLNFISAFEGFAKLIHYIVSSVKTIHKYLIKPLVSSVFSHAITAISDVLGGLGSRLSGFIDIISNGDPLKDFATKIYRVFSANTDLYAFFDNVTNAILIFNDAIWNAAEGAVTFFTNLMDSKPLRTIKGAFSVLWGVIEPFISNNSKSGMAVGGIIGAVINGVKGFFKGGPFGLITGALKGFAGGALKGKFFGTLLDVFNYLINNKDRIIGLFQEIGTRISVLFESFKTGFTSKYNPIMFVANGVIALARGLHDLFTGKVDPITQLTNFVKGDTFNGFIEKLKAPFVTFGNWISGIWDFIYTNVSTFFKNIGLKWETYMTKNNNNPFEAFANMFKDSNLYKILSTIGGIFKDLFDAIVGGFNTAKEAVANSKLFDSKAFKNLPLVTQIQLKIEDFRKSLEKFREGDFFKGIKDFFSGIGEGIHEAWKAITSGDILGIIIDFFTTIGSLFKSFFDGIFGVEVSAAEMDETVEAIAPKSLSERLSSMKTAFDDFLGSDSFASMQSRFNGFGQFLTTTVLPILKDVGDKILWVLHLFTPAKINGIYVGKGPALTVDGIIEDVKQLGSILGGIFKSFYEGFSGKEFTDDATGIIASLNQMIFDLGESLKNFSTSEAFTKLKEFAAYIGGEFRDKIEWLGTTLLSIPEKLNNFTNPFAGVKQLLKDAPSTEKLAEEISKPFETLGESIIPKGKGDDNKAGSFFDGVLSKIGTVFDFLTGVQEVSADTLDEFETVTKQVASTVAYSRDQNWETGTNTVTLKDAKETAEGVADAANALNEGADEAEEGAKSTESYIKFMDNLGSAAKIIAGVGALILGGTFVHIFMGVGSFLKGLFNVVTLVGNVSGAIRASTFLKYMKMVGIMVLAIAGLALVIDSLDNQASLVNAILVVLGSLLTILVAMSLFNTSSEKYLGDLPTEAMSTFKSLIDAVSDGVKELFSKIGQIALMGAFVAAIVVIAGVITKLSQNAHPENFDKALIVVGAIALGLVALIAALGAVSKFLISKETALKMIAVAGALLSLAAGVAVLSLAITYLMKEFKKLMKDSSFDYMKTVVPTILTIVGAMAVLIVGMWAVMSIMPKNPFDLTALLAGAVSILALSVGVNLLVKAMIELMKASEEIPSYNNDRILKIGEVVAILVLALGGFVALSTITDNAVALRTSFALIVVAFAVKLMVGTLKDLMDYFQDNQLDTKPFIDWLGPTGILAVIALVLGGTIWMMEHGAVALRTIFAIGAIVLAVELMILEIKQLMSIFKELPDDKNGLSKVEQFKEIMGAITQIIIELGVLMMALKTKKIGITGVAVYKANSGFAAALGMIAAVGAVALAISTIQGISKIKDWSSYQKAFESFELVLWSLAGATVAVAHFGQGASLASIGLAITLIIGTIAAFWTINGLIKSKDKIEQIGESIALVIGVLGVAIALINAAAPKGVGNGFDVWDEVFLMVAMIGSVTLALVLAANNIKSMDGILELAEGLALVLGALTGIAWALGEVGKVSPFIDAGLVAITKLGGLIAIIVGIFPLLDDINSWITDTIFGGKFDPGKWMSDSAGDISEKLGELLTTFAGFLGTLVKTFKESAMVDDVDSVSDYTEAVAVGMNALSENVNDIDVPQMDKIVEVMGAFEALALALSNIYGINNGVNNIFATFGDDMAGFGTNFTEFANSITGLDGEVDTELVASICGALAQIGGTELPTNSSFFKQTVDYATFGANIAGLTTAIHALYDMCTDVTDVGIVDNVTGLLENLWKYLEAAEDYEKYKTSLEALNDVLTSIGNFGANDDRAIGTLDKVIELMRAMTELNGIFANSSDDSLGFIESIFNTLNEKHDTIVGIGSGIAAILMSGFKSFMDTDRFSDAVGYVVKGLTVVLSEKYKEEIIEAGFDLASTLEQAFRDAMGIESPSTVMMGLGIYIIQGLIEGMEKQENPLIQKITSICKNITDAFKNNIKFEGPVADELKAGFDSFTKGVSGFIADPMSIFDSKKGKKNKKTHSTVPGSVQRTYYGKRDKAIIDTNKNIEAAIKEATDAATGELDYDKFVDSIISSAMGEDFGKLVEEAQENGNYLGVLTGAIDLLKENNKELDKKILKNGADQETLENKSILEGVIDYLTGNLKNEEKETYSVIEAFNGWVDENVVDPVKQYAKDKLSDNELLSLILNGLEDREEGESILDYLKRKGIKISETQLKRVMEGDFFKTLISELGLGEITENTEVWSEWLSESGGDINKLIEIIQKSVPGLNLSESDLANKITTMFDFMNASGFDMFDGKSNLYDSLKEFIPDNMFGDMLGDMGLDSFGLDSLGDAGSSLGDAFGKSFEQSTEQAVDQVDQRITDMAMRVIRGDFGNNPDRQRILESMGYSFGVIQNEVNRLLGCNYRYAVSNEDVKRTIEALGGSVDDTSQKIANSASQTRQVTSENVDYEHTLEGWLNQSDLNPIWWDLRTAISKEALSKDHDVNVWKLIRIAMDSTKTYEEFADTLAGYGIDVTKAEQNLEELWSSWQETRLKHPEENEYLKQMEKEVEYEQEFYKISKEAHDKLDGSDFWGTGMTETLLETLEVSKDYEDFCKRISSNHYFGNGELAYTEAYWNAWIAMSDEAKQSTDKLSNSIDGYAKAMVDANNATYSISDNVLESTVNSASGKYLTDIIKELDLKSYLQEDINTFADLMSELKNSTSLEDFKKALTENVEVFGEDTIEKAEKIWDSYQNYIKEVAKETVIVYEDNASNLYNYDQMKENADNYVEILEDENNKIVEVLETGNEKISDASKKINNTIYKYRYDGNRAINYKTSELNFNAMAEVMDDIDLNDAEKAKETIDTYRKTYQDLVELKNRQGERLLPEKVEKDLETVKELNSIIKQYKDNYSKGLVKNEGPHGGYGLDGMTIDMANRLLTRDLNDYLMNHAQDYTKVTDDLTAALAAIKEGDYDKTIESLDKAYGNLSETVGQSDIKVKQGFANAIKYLEEGNQEKASLHLNNVAAELRQAAGYQEEINKELIANENAYRNIATVLLNPNAHFKYDETTIPKLLDDMNSWAINSIGKETGNIPQDSYSELAFTALRQKLEQMGLGFTEEFNNLGEIIGMSIFGELGNNLFDVTYQNGKLIAKSFEEGVQRELLDQPFEDSINALNRRMENSRLQTLENMERHIKEINDGLTDDSKMKLLGKQLDEAGNISEIFLGSVDGEKTYRLFYENGKVIGEYLAEGIKSGTTTHTQTFEESVDQLQRRIANSSKQSIEDVGRFISDINKTLDEESQLKILDKTADQSGQIFRMLIGDANGEKMISVASENGQLVARNFVKGFVDESLAYMAEETPKTVEELSAYIDKMLQSDAKTGLLSQSMQKISNAAKEVDGVANVIETFDSLGNIIDVSLYDATGEKMASYVYENGNIIGTNIITGAIDGVDDKKDNLMTTMNKLTSDYIINPVKTVLDSNSPSVVFVGIGEDAIRGFIDGANTMAEPLYDTLKTIMTNAVYMAAQVWQASEIAADDNFQFTPSITPVVDTSKSTGLGELLTNGGPMSVNIATTPGFERIMSISDMFERRLSQDAVIIDSMTSMQNSINELNRTNEATNTAIGGLRKDVNSLNASMSNLKVVLNDDTLVGKITPSINRELGKIQTRRERSV